MERMQQSWSSAITVFVAESNSLNCQLVETALRRGHRGFSVLGSATDLTRTLELIEDCKPDVAVISAELESGSLDGYRVLRQLRSIQCHTRMVLLLSTRERDLVLDAFRCGAHGVVFRDEDIETLARCIAAVNQRQVWANSQQLGYLLDALTQQMPLNAREGARLDLLSKRQEQVVRLVAEGMTNRGVAAKMGLSEHTVRNYMFQIFDRLGVSTRVELVLYYLNSTRGAAIGAD